MGLAAPVETWAHRTWDSRAASPPRPPPPPAPPEPPRSSGAPPSPAPPRPPGVPCGTLPAAAPSRSSTTARSASRYSLNPPVGQPAHAETARGGQACHTTGGIGTRLASTHLIQPTHRRTPCRPAEPHKLARASPPGPPGPCAAVACTACGPAATRPRCPQAHAPHRRARLPPARRRHRHPPRRAPRRGQTPRHPAPAPRPLRTPPRRRTCPNSSRPATASSSTPTRVLPARFRGVGKRTHRGRGRGPLPPRRPAPHADHPNPGPDPSPDPGLWLAMIKSRRHRPGAMVRLLRGNRPSPYTLEMLEPAADPPGVGRPRPQRRRHAHRRPGVLESIGLTPLPPTSSPPARPPTTRRRPPRPRAVPDRLRRSGRLRVAAPAAGLHFTPGLLTALAARGIDRTDVVLHVGAGTFKPVETDTVEAHPMHAQWCSMSAAAVGEIQRHRTPGGAWSPSAPASVHTIESYAPLAAAAELPDHLSTHCSSPPGARFAWTDAMLRRTFTCPARPSWPLSPPGSETRRAPAPRRRPSA